MRYGRVVCGVVVAVVLGVCVTPAPAASRKQSSSAVEVFGKYRTPGVPPGGPAALYARPPKLAMTTNHDRRFRAPFNLVSGSERYVRGEYTYTGYAYDDQETTYPADFSRYANNSANLVEFRIAPESRSTLYRFTFLTLLKKDTTIGVVAFDTDRNAATGSATLPKDPGAPFPGTDQVLTAWGTGAEWSTWTSSGWRSTAVKISTDVTANQLTVEVPHTVSRPSGVWRSTLATGVYDPSTKGWLPIAANSATTSNIVNLGFRFNETRVGAGKDTTDLPDLAVPPKVGLNPTLAPWEHQNAALKAGTPTVFAHDLRFDWLAQRKTWDNVPTRGYFLRMAPSFLAGGTANTGSNPSGISHVDDLGLDSTTVVHEFRTEGKDPAVLESEFYSPLQPYVIYIPEHYKPGTPTRLTFVLHPDQGPYYDFGNGPIPRVWGEARNSILVSPLARSNTNFFLQEQEQGIFEAWNDVARHYTLDPTRTVVTGLSGGAGGAYHLATMWPSLLAGVVALVPPGQRGIYFPGLSDEETVLNNWLPNLRNVPVYHLADMASELTFYPGAVQNAMGPALLGNSLENLKYRYVFRSVAKDHFLAQADYPAIATWMGDRTAEDRPFHVTYVRQPTNDTPDAGIVHNKAYWLSQLEVRDSSARVAKGTIDAVSYGFGLAQPDTALKAPIAGMDAPGNVFVQTERYWDSPKPTPRQDRLVITATNIRHVTIDPAAARLTCSAQVEIHSDGPLTVELRGCARSVRS